MLHHAHTQLIAGRHEWTETHRGSGFWLVVCADFTQCLTLTWCSSSSSDLLCVYASHWCLLYVSSSGSETKLKSDPVKEQSQVTSMKRSGSEIVYLHWGLKIWNSLNPVAWIRVPQLVNNIKDIEVIKSAQRFSLSSDVRIHWGFCLRRLWWERFVIRVRCYRWRWS